MVTLQPTPLLPAPRTRLQERGQSSRLLGWTTGTGRRRRPTASAGDGASRPGWYSDGGKTFPGPGTETEPAGGQQAALAWCKLPPRPSAHSLVPGHVCTCHTQPHAACCLPSLAGDLTRTGTTSSEPVSQQLRRYGDQSHNPENSSLRLWTAKGRTRGPKNVRREAPTDGEVSGCRQEVLGTPGYGETTPEAGAGQTLEDGKDTGAGGLGRRPFSPNAPVLRFARTQLTRPHPHPHVHSSSD